LVVRLLRASLIFGRVELAPSRRRARDELGDSSAVFHVQLIVEFGGRGYIIPEGLTGGSGAWRIRNVINTGVIARSATERASALLLSRMTYVLRKS
jgi:hypothetical protein